MSFVGNPFKHDIFVSYSHGAFDSNHDPDLKQWSNKFVNDLRNELVGTAEFEDLSLYLDESNRSDESIDRTANLSEHLMQSVRVSALLTVLMTPHYLRSNWCRQEREWWHEVQESDTVPTKGRVFICRVRPTDDASWPSDLPMAAGYHCYDQNKEPDRARPYTWRGSSRDLDEYNEILIDLAGDIMQQLRSIKDITERQRRHDEEAARLTASGQVIYLHARQEQEKIWEKTATTLVNRGFVVVPGEPDPVVRKAKQARDIANRRIETLSACDGLLLLGTEDGRALDADLVVVGRQDRHSARDRSDRLLPCAVLNANCQDLATMRRKRTAQTLGIHWIEGKKGTWATDVQSWLLEAGQELERA